MFILMRNSLLHFKKFMKYLSNVSSNKLILAKDAFQFSENIYNLRKREKTQMMIINALTNFQLTCQFSMFKFTINSMSKVVKKLLS